MNRVEWIVFILIVEACFGICNSADAGNLSQAGNCRSMISRGISEVELLEPVEEQDESALESARAFLTLLDLGMTNLGAEVSSLHASLQDALVSEFPINPFLNLHSPLGLALSARAESLIPALEPDWKVLRERLVERTGTVGDAIDERQRDVARTSMVDEMQEVPMDPSWKLGAPDMFRMEYIGQTSAEYLFAENRRGKNDTWFFRLSKVDRKFAKFATVVNSQRHIGSKAHWFRDGLIYGFGHPLKTKISERSKTVQVFRIDPKTSEIQWAPPWAGEVGFEKAAGLLTSSNKVLGVRFQAERYRRQGHKGEIWRFDFDRFQFVPADLQFDTSVFISLPSGWNGKIRRSDLSFDSHGNVLKIGSYFRTDGITIFQVHDDEGYVFSVTNWIKQEVSMIDSHVTMSLIEMLPFSSLAGSGSKSRRAFPRDPIQFKLPKGSLSVSDHFPMEAVDDGRSILFLWTHDHGPLGLAIVIDRATWTARSVLVEGGPPTDIPGKWSLIRNSTGEVLLWVSSMGEEVEPWKFDFALWKFDFATAKFQLQFHEVLEYDPESPAIGSFVDLETKSFVGWVRQSGMRVLLPVTLSRDR